MSDDADNIPGFFTKVFGRADNREPGNCLARSGNRQAFPASSVVYRGKVVSADCLAAVNS